MNSARHLIQAKLPKQQFGTPFCTKEAGIVPLSHLEEE
jgi:hypothetical protein